MSKVACPAQSPKGVQLLDIGVCAQVVFAGGVINVAGECNSVAGTEARASSHSERTIVRVRGLHTRQAGCFVSGVVSAQRGSNGIRFFTVARTSAQVHLHNPAKDVGSAENRRQSPYEGDVLSAHYR